MVLLAREVEKNRMSFCDEFTRSRSIRDYGGDEAPMRRGLRPRINWEGPQTDPNTKIVIDNLMTSDQLGIIGLDLRIGGRVAKSNILKTKVDWSEYLQMQGSSYIAEGEEYLLEPDPSGENIYYVESYEAINLGTDLEMIVDSKSTAGRLGCMTQLVGKSPLTNKLILAIQPFSFPIKIIGGETSLFQAAIRYKNTPYLTREEILKGDLVTMNGESPKKSMVSSEGLVMNFSSGIAYEALAYDRDNMPPIDLTAKDLDPDIYFRKLEWNPKERLAAGKNRLYLLGSSGVIGLGSAAGYLSRSDAHAGGGSSWCHLAGIFQPYWEGEITMEYFSRVNTELSNGDLAGYVKFDRIEGEEPADLEKHKGDYFNQKAPRLPKIFKEN